jgi:hypothetical protein
MIEPMKSIAFATALLLTLTSSALAQPQPGEIFEEATETRSLGVGPTAALYVGKTYGSPPKFTTTLWLFFRTPKKLGMQAYNTSGMVAEVDCGARTVKRTHALALYGDIFGKSRTSRVVMSQPLTEAPATYASDTPEGLALKLLCSGEPLDESLYPTFATLSEARAFGIHMSAEAARKADSPSP